MGKKFLKDNIFKKSLVDTFISSNKEISKNVNTADRKNVNTENNVKLTVVIPEELDILLEDIARKRRKETGKKPTKKSLIIEALKLLAKKENLL